MIAKKKFEVDHVRLQVLTCINENVYISGELFSQCNDVHVPYCTCFKIVDECM